MKYLKTYEKIIYCKKPPYPDPKYGYYVICQDDNPDINNFISNNIGKIIGIRKDLREPYVVEYENIPPELRFYFSHPHKNTRAFQIKEIECWSKNKKELEDYLIEKKFNI